METVKNFWTGLQQNDKRWDSEWALLIVKTVLSSQISYNSFKSLWFLVATVTQVDYHDFVSGWSFPRNVSKYSQVHLAHSELVMKEVINRELSGVLSWIIRRNFCKHKKILHSSVSVTFCAQVSPARWWRLLSVSKWHSRKLYTLFSWKEGWTVLTFTMRAKQLCSKDLWLPFLLNGNFKVNSLIVGHFKKVLKLKVLHAQLLNRGTVT